MRAWTRRRGLAVVILLASLLLAARLEAAQDSKTSGAAAAPAAPMTVAVAGALSGLLGGTGGEIAGQPLPIADLRASYATAGYEPIWTTDAGLSPAGRALAERLVAAQQAGMSLPAPLLAAIDERRTATDAPRLGELELLLSGALLTATADSDDLDPQALLTALRAGDPAAITAQHLSTSFYYWRLAHALPVYRGYVAAGGWPHVPSGPKLEPGARDPRVQALTQRLLATGDLAAAGSDPSLYDPALVAAVKKFQARHGLDADGKLGPQTIAALNVSAQERLDQILLNLERFRALGPAMGDRFLYVNVAGMELSLVEHGRITFFNRVIVGRKDRPTPLLRSVIRRIDFNPVWVVPAKIARIDILGHEHQDPTFLRTHDIHVYDGWGANAHEIDPAGINWSQYNAGNMPFAFRQDPGSENALGPVKFDFANDYAVYVHGTPVQSLFALAARALSSGCIRMEHPVDLAIYLLRDDPNWPRARIEDVVRKATTISASLKDPLPIMLTYQTAWVDEAGLLQFRADVYGLDRTGGPALTAGVPGAPMTPGASPGKPAGGVPPSAGHKS